VRATFTIVIIAFLTSFGGSSAETCGLTQSFEQADRDRDTNKPITRKVLFDSKVIVFSVPMHVDADGGPHTYGAKDPAGTLCDPKYHPENVGKDPIALGCAIDSVCDGVSIAVPGGQTLDYRSCSPLLKAFALIRDSQWNPPKGYLLLSVGIEMRDKGKGIPCVDPSGNYLVSTSSTPSGVPGKQCEQQKWLDTMVPSIVVPECWSVDYRKNNPKDCAVLPAPGMTPDIDPGDLVALRGQKSGNMTYGVIGDLGPNSKLGEASVGLLTKAAGQKGAPTYRRATDALDGLETFDVIVFKGTLYDKSMTPDNQQEMEKAAQKAFESWTGNLRQSAAALAACGASTGQ
jgi:hypothetical protein